MRTLSNIVTALVCGGMSSSVCATVIYVDSNAPASGDGTSWATAFTDLQDGLAAANVTDNEIWVAAGAYRPTSAGGSRSVSFQLLNGVTIYGGFSGDETTLAERDIVNNETILTGDLNGDDSSNFANNAENSYHVVNGTGTNSSAVIDGFTIRGGNADGPPPNHNLGGGVLMRPGSATVRTCRFMSNDVGNGGHGGGICVDQGGVVLIEDCTFVQNRVHNNGAGIYGYFATLTIRDCVFSTNTCMSTNDPKGAALFHGCNTTVTGCEFTENDAGARGGGLYVVQGSIIITDCSIQSNVAGIEGGGLFNESGSTYVLIASSSICGNTPDQIYPPNSYDDGGNNVIAGACTSELEISFDIKPGSCPNPLNLSSRGYVPMAILGTEDLDVSTVDSGSISLSWGNGDEVYPHEGPPGPHTVIEDAGTPFNGVLCDCHDLDGDGVNDLLMKFKTVTLIDVLGLSSLSHGDSAEIVLTGTLTDGTPIVGRDCFIISGGG